MIVYLDSSIVLSSLLGEPAALADWQDWDPIFSSSLLVAEVRRTFDRLGVTKARSADDVRALTAAFDILLVNVRLRGVTTEIVEAAAQPMPVVVKTLDALHIATALAILPFEPGLIFATHDKQQAAAASALGLQVIGV